ncbi:unnamed protein product [Echinostoma caproni]|uniref:Similar to n=1 Tax=Echinostoma caproni TaxID=27848 RepID=A0A183B7Y6_9TREM|nr:unnamed protein product [Echinostoma caproni]
MAVTDRQLQGASFPIASSTLCTVPYTQTHYPRSDPHKAHSVSLGGPITNGLDKTNVGQDNPVSAPVQFPSDPHPSGHSLPHSHHELDTDADSSAFTDLSQVSSASRNGHRHTDRTSSSSAHQQSPPYSLDLSQLSDPNRIAELNRRNRLQPMHLRTSYPVETQTANPEKVAVALRQLSSKSQGKDELNGFRKQNGTVTLSTVPEEYGNVLREMGDENMADPSQSSSRRTDSSTARNTDRLSKSGSQSDRSELMARSTRVAAGYRPIPKNLNSITDALIAASDDPSTMVAALEMQLTRAALIGSKEETSRKAQEVDPSQSPPTLSIRSSRGSVHSDKQNSSIAFEILLDPASTKPRRLPAPRANSSAIVRRLPGSKNSVSRPITHPHNGAQQFPSAKLPLASTLPTPLQRNPKVNKIMSFYLKWHAMILILLTFSLECC